MSSQSLHKTTLGFLQTCCGCIVWCFGVMLSSGSGCVSDSCLLLSLFSSYWVAFSSINMRTFALSYYISFSCVWLLSIGGLIFSEEKLRGRGRQFGRKRRSEGIGRNRGWGKLWSVCMYERKIYFQ